MANIAIARVCNLRCPYCFAGGYMASADADAVTPFITVSAFLDRLDFLARSGIDEVRLIGGEPTLHPQFSALVGLARERGFRVVVFSNGLMPEAALACLEMLSPVQCSVLINMNATCAAGGPTPQEQARRHGTLKRLGPRAKPGYTIDNVDFRLNAIVPTIAETGCQQSIRIGLAHPIFGAENRHVHPKQYPAIGHRLALFALAAAHQGIHLELDCGFVRCMFSTEDWEILRCARTEMRFCCSPILDVDITGTVAHCFPLSGTMTIDALDGQCAEALREVLSTQARLYHMAGIYRECATCQFKAQGNCAGGCLAATLRRFRSHPFAVKISVWPR
jgi:sulfatase maturation enzyme AslB (radical SAM superfamily)